MCCGTDVALPIVSVNTLCLPLIVAVILVRESPEGNLVPAGGGDGAPLGRLGVTAPTPSGQTLLCYVSTQHELHDAACLL